MHVSYFARKGQVKFRIVRDSFLNFLSLVFLWLGCRYYVIGAICIASIGILLRLHQYLLNRALWYDEASLAINIVNKSYLQLSHKLDFYQFATIGFTMTERLMVTSFGNNEYALRALPLLCGVLAVVAFYKMAKIFTKPLYLLLAMAYFSFSPCLIGYSAQVKEYSSDVLMSIMFCLGIIYASTRPLTKTRIIVYGGIGAISVWLLVKIGRAHV